MSDTLISALTRATRRKREWLKLDNAGLIFPATYSKKQNHLYRVSAMLTESIDRDILKQALGAILPRFPSVAVSLHRGLFWYYFEPISKPPEILDDMAWPLTPMSFSSIRKCGFRVLVRDCELSLEFFHAITDGGGALSFLKTLLAEYIERRYGVRVPCVEGVLDRGEAPRAEELEDCFPRFAGPSAKKRDGVKAYRPGGTLEKDGYITYTTLSYDLSQALDCAREYGVSLTGLLCAIMMQALIRTQKKEHPDEKQRMIAVSLPVNLRKMFPTPTLRNFSLYATPYIDPNQGEWELAELCHRVRCQMGERITPKEMAAGVATNVRTAQMYTVRLMPLFIKKLAMKLAYRIIGNDSCCLSISNLGVIKLPEVMYGYVDDIQCMMDSHAGAVISCCAMSFGQTLHVKFCRCIRESTLELEFYKALRDIGLRARVKSNRR